MSRPLLTLAFRPLSVPARQKFQWVCQRCLASQTAAQHPRVAGGQDYQPSPQSVRREGINAFQDNEPYLERPLPQKYIPHAYLRYSTSDALHDSEKAQREKLAPHKKIVGVVVSSGLMDKTVKVRVAGQRWNQRIGKMFDRPTNHLVHDPNNSLVTGDVVELHRLRVSRRVEHVVGSIVSPFGDPIESRPPVPTPDERLAAYKKKRFAKFERRESRKQEEATEAEAAEQARALKPQKEPTVQAKARENKDNAMKLEAKAREILADARTKSDGDAEAVSER